MTNYSTENIYENSELYAVKVTPNDGYVLTLTSDGENEPVDGFVVIPINRVDEILPTIMAVKEDVGND